MDLFNTQQKSRHHKHQELNYLSRPRHPPSKEVTITDSAKINDSRNRNPASPTITANTEVVVIVHAARTTTSEAKQARCYYYTWARVNNIRIESASATHHVLLTLRAVGHQQAHFKLQSSQNFSGTNAMKDTRLQP